MIFLASIKCRGIGGDGQNTTVCSHYFGNTDSVRYQIKFIYTPHISIRFRGVLQYKTIYVKIKIKLKKIHIVITNIKQSKK